MNPGKELQRRTELARGAGPHRTGRLPQRRSEPRRRDRGDEERWLTVVKPLAWQRCGGCCEACGDRMSLDTFDCHHRQLRSRGGPDHISNAAAVHSQCHTSAPWAIHRHPRWAENRGLMVPSWDDPEAAPLWLPYRRRVLLSADGRYVDMPVLP